MYHTNQVKHQFGSLNQTDFELVKPQTEGGELIGQSEGRLYKDKLKIACVAVCAMGHFIPI